MSPAGGGFPDIYICFLCIRAAQLEPTEKTLLMASMAGRIGFFRVSKQLCQLSQPTNPAAKEDILRVTTEPSPPPNEDSSYEARSAYKKGNQQRIEGKVLPVLSPNPRGGIQTEKRRTGEKRSQSTNQGTESLVSVRQRVSSPAQVSNATGKTGSRPARCSPLPSAFFILHHYVGRHAVRKEICGTFVYRPIEG